MYKGPVIDACVNHAWANQLELVEYMSPGWREYLGVPNLLPGGGGMITIAPALAYQRPGGSPYTEGAVGIDGAIPVSSYGDLERALLSQPNLERVVLSFDTSALAISLINPYLTAQIARAANDWTIERWLSRDRRLWSLMLVPTQMPDEAAAEIRRVGKHQGIVGVLMAGNGFARTFGHPVYHPIYQAAVEMNLPIVIKAGAESLSDSPALSTGAGEAATYSEFRILECDSLMTHVATMITQGVFSKFPSLRVLVIGGGRSWVPSFLWRFDAAFKGLRREVPWVQKLPSEYFREHVRVASYPRDPVPTGSKAKAIFDTLDDITCFASGYPYWDCLLTSETAETLNAESARNVMYENARFLFDRSGGIAGAAKVVNLAGDLPTLNQEI